MENKNGFNIKRKQSKIYLKDLNYDDNNNLVKKEKVKIYFELFNIDKDTSYEISVLEKTKNEYLKSNRIKSSENNKYKYDSICEYIFGKEQKLSIEIKLKENNKQTTINIPIHIGQLLGNNKKNKNNTALFKIKGRKEEVKVKLEKMRRKELFLIVQFRLEVVSQKDKEISEEEIINYFKDEKYKFYFVIEKKTGEKIYESEAFTDDGKFNIVQIPKMSLDTDFIISFFNYKNNFGKIVTNLKEFTDPKKKKGIFFCERLSIDNRIDIYNNSSIREEITFLDYINKKIRIGLCIGIDFTISNKNPYDKDSLHCIIDETKRNPYERAIIKCGNILGFYDYDQKFPVYGFGAVVNSINSDCFNINFEKDPNIEFVDNIIKSYHECLNKIFLSGPTFFSPIIKNIINEIKKQNDPKEYQVLMILTDGIIQDMDKTIDALVEGSFYPLSVIIIGIGDADFSKMEKLDGDEIPLISSKGIKRQRDLVQFVPFSKFEGDEEKLANEVLEKIPRQIIEYYTLNFIYPESLNDNNFNINDYSIVNSFLKNKNEECKTLTSNSQLFKNSSFTLFEKTNSKEINENKNNNNYYKINEMFDKINEKKINKMSYKKEIDNKLSNTSKSILNEINYDFDKSLKAFRNNGNRKSFNSFVNSNKKENKK